MKFGRFTILSCVIVGNSFASVQREVERTEENENRARLIEDMELREGEELKRIRQYRKEELARAKQEAEELRRELIKNLGSYCAQEESFLQAFMAALAETEQKVGELKDSILDLINEEREARQRESAAVMEVLRAIVDSLTVKLRDPEING